MKPSPPHPDAFQQAVARELVRVTLTGRPDRPELYAPVVDPARLKRFRKRRKRN